jgi:phospholipase/carboxylesterase
MSTISDRNYLGIAVDVTAAPAADDLSVDREALLLDLAARVELAVGQARRAVHVHTERVFLAGFGTGATWALELGLARPEWFAGMISLAGQFPPARQALRRFRDLRGKRVLLGTGRRDERATVEEIHSAGRLLHSAGLRVCTRLYDARHEIIREMLNDVDRWVMQEIYQPGVAA